MGIEAGNGMAALTVVLLLVGITAGALYINSQTGNPLKIPGQGSVVGAGGQNTGAGAGGCANNYVAPVGFTCVNFPAQYYVFDPEVQAGTASGITGAQVSVIDPSTLASKDVPSTTASTGLVTGSTLLISGQSYYCKIVTSNYVTEFIPCFIPPVSSTGTGVTSINLPLPQIKTNSWSWSAAGAGTTWTSSFSTYNYANTGLTSISMTFTVTAVTNNEGYYSGYDVVAKYQNLAISEFSSASTPKTTISNCQFSTTRNNINYCQDILPDGYTTINPSYTIGSSAITANFPTTVDGRYTSTAPRSQTITINGVSVTGSLSQTLSGTTQNGGTLSFSKTFAVGSLSAASENWTWKVWLYSDVTNFDGGNGYSQQGTYGTDSSQATLQGGNSVTITLIN